MTNPAHANLSGPTEVHPPLGNSPHPNVLAASQAESYRLEQVTTGYNFFNVDTSTSIPITTLGDASLKMLLSLVGGAALTATAMTTASITYSSGHTIGLVGTGSSAVSYTLPVPSAASGHVWLFLDSAANWGTNAFTLNRAAGGNINGAASNVTYSTSGSCVLVYCDGTNYFAYVMVNSQPATQAALDASILQHQIFAR